MSDGTDEPAIETLVKTYNLSREASREIAALLRSARQESPKTIHDVGTIDTLALVSIDSSANLAAHSSSWSSGEFDAISSGTVERAMFGRYEKLERVGQGGMGEVFRVRDLALNRKMVMKIIRGDRMQDIGALARFVDEAQITSQLEHPGIVHVHEIGRLDDGRVYFTMEEVRGRTLTEVIKRTHESFQSNEASGWDASFRSLINLFRRSCEPVAYAHSRGVIHRDLKPSNIMIGDFGGVQIIDWGLAKILGRVEHVGLGEEASEIQSTRSVDESHDTRAGSIVGTPAFMPPEQARGELNQMGPAADVYSLGALLYMMLDGRPPFEGANSSAIILQVIEGIERIPGEALGAPVELQRICMKAMALEPSKRYESAAELAVDVVSWLDGAGRRDRAWELVAKAGELTPIVAELERRADELSAQSETMLSALSAHASVALKRPAWELQDEAATLEHEITVRRARMIQHLDTALTYVPTLTEAHNRLAEIYRKDHDEAERRRDMATATSSEVFLRAHNRGLHDGYLNGAGTMSVITDVPAAVEMYRYVKQDRRLVPSLKRRIGRTPLRNVELAMGSYLLVIRAPGRAEVRYPVHIARQSDWHGTQPGYTDPAPIHLPEVTEIDDSEVYVPAGWFTSGSDGVASQRCLIERHWVDGFVISRHPITHHGYLEFLNALVDDGRLDEARRAIPRETDESTIYQQGGDARFELRADRAEMSSWPVNFVDWHSANAYTCWYAERSAQPWRLPTEIEWEKAARGVDGRFFPWGDYLDPTWCRMIHSTRGIPYAVSIDSYPDDESPYGVRGMGGNVRDWCADEVHPVVISVDDSMAPSLRCARGGAWFATADLCRVATRELRPPDARSSGIGFRMVRSFGNYELL
ncbi:MAG: SUMF1/EgtB/PvdO family nonheme iron enzyme [Bradymonadaceae bacterium]|nr:SUMF1/EgtB/PvdO family nonheme iron enzyme [Lujinxingiaceae bacterium]